MKFLKQMIGAFDGLLLAVTTAVMIVPFLFAVMAPAAKVVHVIH
jgi:hypothetical protein